MPKYIYTAKSLDGETKTGNLEAKDIHQLAQTLRQESLILIRARPEGLEKKKFNFSFSFFGVPLAEKLFFTRNLQVMISSGLPLPRALGTLALQAKSSKFKKALLKIKEEITKGRALSEAMISQSDIFSPLFQNMIKVGEEGGTLEEVLKTLTVQLNGAGFSLFFDPEMVFNDNNFSRFSFYFPPSFSISKRKDDFRRPHF